MKIHCSLALIAALLIIGVTVHGEPPAAVADESSVYQLQSHWTTDGGRNLALSDLAGHYQIVALVFTHCGGTCPLLVKSLQAQSRNMPPRVRQRTRFVLVSMDPDRDTEQALRDYRSDMSLDEHWTLLRGNEGDVRELAAVLGFNYARSANGEITHSNQITLLNPSGTIVSQHPSAEDAVHAMSALIAACDASSAAGSHNASKDCR